LSYVHEPAANFGTRQSESRASSIFVKHQIKALTRQINETVVAAPTESIPSSRLHSEVPAVPHAPTFGPLVKTCALYGIGRTQSFSLARLKAIDVFHIGSRAFVTYESLDSLPQRSREAQGGVA
jgi:hypothetical protein